MKRYDYSKKLRTHLLLAKLKSKDISLPKSGCLFVAHRLAELQVSYISCKISSQPLSPTDENIKRFSSDRRFKQQ